jgi:cytochrome c oxidase subunit 2
MHLLRRLWAVCLATSLVTVLSGGAFAQVPKPWQMNLQAAHSPVAESVASLNSLVLWIITAITVFVAGLLAYVVFRYNRKKNPTPSRVSHNTTLEVAWTLIPVLILVVIAIPSFRLVYLEDRTHAADITIKVTGHQWYWEYDYADTAKINFASRMIPNEEIKAGQLRLLDVDNQLVVPAGKNVRVLATSGDVIHSWFIPSLGVQRYAIPGRIIETWFRVNEPGTYYGECNQICGTQHSGMPISIKALPEAEFQAWLAGAKTKFASEPALIPAEKRADGRVELAQIQR